MSRTVALIWLVWSCCWAVLWPYQAPPQPQHQQELPPSRWRDPWA